MVACPGASLPTARRGGQHAEQLRQACHVDGDEHLGLHRLGFGLPGRATTEPPVDQACQPFLAFAQRQQPVVSAPRRPAFNPLGPVVSAGSRSHDVPFRCRKLGAIVAARKQVPIYVAGHDDGRVAQPGLHDLDR
jgi:hypothetical protein